MLKTLLCVLTVGVLVGCGGGNEPEIPQNPTPPPSTPEKVDLPTGPPPSVEP